MNLVPGEKSLEKGRSSIVRVGPATWKTFLDQVKGCLNKGASGGSA